MTQSDNFDRGTSGSDTDSRLDFDVDLGDPREYVDGTTVRWSALVTFLLVIPILWVAEMLSRFVAALLSIPQMVFAGGGDVYSDLYESLFHGWQSVFETSFAAAATDVADFGVLGYVIAVAFIIGWYLLLERLWEVL